MTDRAIEWLVASSREHPDESRLGKHERELMREIAARLELADAAIKELRDHIAVIGDPCDACDTQLAKYDAARKAHQEQGK